MKKFQLNIYLLLTLFIYTASTYAQGIESANSALTEVTSQVSSLFSTVKIFGYSVSGILAIVGAVKVYNAYQGGEQDASKKAGAWFFGALFLALAIFFAEKFFMSSGS
jgi:hypothetical protein